MTHYQLAMLWSDWIIWSLMGVGVVAFFWMRRQPHLREPWRQVLKHKMGMIALVILSFYMAIGLLDSIHLQISQTNSQGQHTKIVTRSVFDLLVMPLGQNDERSYSAPFATHAYSQSLVTLTSGKEVRAYPKLKFAGKQIQTKKQHQRDITWRLSKGLLTALISLLIILSVLFWILSRKSETSIGNTIQCIFSGKTDIAWREAIITFTLTWLVLWVCIFLAANYHVLGTDKIGKDVFYAALKSIRTGLLIGTLTTLFMLPFALVLGTVSGFYRGWIDDIIQYLYTTLSSIPGVLLISAAVLVLQVYISNHPNLFPTLLERADARLLALCFILGITSWAGLCRLLRGETLKLRNMDYIQAARALGVKNRKIIWRHILPNVMHIVLITLVLDFSGLVLAEAVLSYVGVGVDPTTLSWGNMINSSRLELAREPIVWWPLVAALIFMFILVLCANLFSDSVRDAFDPHLREIEQNN